MQRILFIRCYEGVVAWCSSHSVRILRGRLFVAQKCAVSSIDTFHQLFDQKSHWLYWSTIPHIRGSVYPLSVRETSCKASDMLTFRPSNTCVPCVLGAIPANDLKSLEMLSSHANLCIEVEVGNVIFVLIKKKSCLL